MSESHLLVLIVQVGLILALGRAMGAVCSALKQPQVMGEMIAGIMLGPSLLQQVAPGVFATVFPPGSIEYLSLLSQIGIIFFLFLIGLELDLSFIRHSGRSAVVISQASIVLPFVLGVGLAVYLHRTTDLFAHGGGAVPVRSAALFLGAAMSITAFPVLARILSERNLHKTRVGAISIACAAVNDASAWCILAFVVAIVKTQGPREAVMTAGLSLAYVALMFLAVRPLLGRLEMLYERQGRLSQNVVAGIILLVLASAYATHRIGIHAMFGAFLMGAIMPKGSQFVRQLGEKLEDFTVVFLLPIFFAFAGLKTQINLINDRTLWLYTALIIAVACAGKFGGTVLSARLCGIDWRQSSAIGVLMNTRGLMELVILNIGLQLGVITDRVYAMMVIMALFTTAMTTPLLYWVYPFRLFMGQGPQKGKRPAGVFAVLVPVSLSRSGGALVQLAGMLGGPHPRVTALYLRRPVDHEAYRAGLDEPSAQRYEPLEHAADQARKLGLEMEPLTFVSRDVPGDIAAVAAQRQVNLVLMGFHKPVIGQAILGGTVHRVLDRAEADVAVFVDRGFRSVKRVLVPYLGSTHDRLAMELAGRIARTCGAGVTVLHVVPPKRTDGQPVLGAKAVTDRVFQDPTQPTPVTFRVVEDASPVDAVLREAKHFDLVVIGVAEEWGLESHLFGWRAERIARDCPSSLLIVRRHAQATVSREVPLSADAGERR